MKQCPYGRGIIAGLVAGIYGWFIGGLVWMKLFGEAASAHAHLWRPMGDPSVTKGMIIAYLIIGLFYSLLYAKLSKALSCIECRFSRGIAFGFLVWLPFGFGCGLLWYMLSPISIDLLYAAWIDKALFLIGGGFLISAIYGKVLACGEGAMVCPVGASEKPAVKSTAPASKAAVATPATTKAVKKTAKKVAKTPAKKLAQKKKTTPAKKKKK